MKKPIFGKLRTILCLVLSLCLVLPFAACDEETTGGEDNKSITISPSPITVKENEDKNVTATLVGIDGEVKWTSADPTIAIVTASTATSKAAVVTGKKAGSTTIKAEAGGKSAECTVNVTAADEVETVTIKLNGSAVGTSEYQVQKGGTPLVFTAEASKGSPIEWESSAPTIASVSNGTVTGLAVGDAVVTAKVSETIKATVNVKVVAELPETVTIKYEGAAVGTTPYEVEKDGTPLVFTAEASKGSPIEWESSAPTIASVSNGTVTGLAVGDAVITAKVSETIKATVNVTVVEGGNGGEQGTPIPQADNQGAAQAMVGEWSYFYIGVNDSEVTVNKCELIGEPLDANNKIIIDYEYAGANWAAFNLNYMLSAGKPAGYEVTFKFESNVAGNLIVSPGGPERLFDIEVGENNIVANFEGAMLWLRFGSDGRNGSTNGPLVGKFTISGIQITEIEPEQLDKPSFTYDPLTKIITIDETINADKVVSSYKLNFYKDDIFRRSVPVVNGEEVEPVGLEPDTYMVKLVAVGDNVRYTDSEESDDEAEITVSSLNTKENMTSISNDGADLNNHKDTWCIWAETAFVTVTEATYDDANKEVVVSYEWTNEPHIWHGVRICYRQTAATMRYIKCTINVQSTGIYMINNVKTTLVAGDNNIYIEFLGTDFLMTFGEMDTNPGRDSQTVKISNIEFTNTAPSADD